MKPPKDSTITILPDLKRIKKGKRVSIIRTLWNDTFTVKYVGKQGTIAKNYPCHICDVDINGITLTFHRSELNQI